MLKAVVLIARYVSTLVLGCEVKDKDLINTELIKQTYMEAFEFTSKGGLALRVCRVVQVLSYLTNLLNIKMPIKKTLRN